MPRIWSFGLGIAAGALVVYERRARGRAERLGAATIETLLDAIEANDTETGAHMRRVAAYSEILADAADLDQHTRRSIERVALFHDIGKLQEALSDIFREQTGLSPEERRAVRTHPARGAAVLAPLVVFYPELGRGVASHHERWDGSGYPKGLKGKRIPIAARVVAIGDTFDAITHRRSYSAARSFKKAVDVIAAGRGSQFDPELVDIFLTPPVLAELEEAMRLAHAPKTKRPNRRRGKQHPASDINFRWRGGTPKRRVRGR